MAAGHLEFRFQVATIIGEKHICERELVLSLRIVKDLKKE
jgi:hypothetical protein